MSCTIVYTPSKTPKHICALPIAEPAYGTIALCAECGTYWEWRGWRDWIVISKHRAEKKINGGR